MSSQKKVRNSLLKHFSESSNCNQSPADLKPSSPQTENRVRKSFRWMSLIDFFLRLPVDFHSLAKRPPLCINRKAKNVDDEWKKKVWMLNGFFKWHRRWLSGKSWTNDQKLVHDISHARSSFHLFGSNPPIKKHVAIVTSRPFCKSCWRSPITLRLLTGAIQFWCLDGNARFNSRLRH